MGYTYMSSHSPGGETPTPIGASNTTSMGGNVSIPGTHLAPPHNITWAFGMNEEVACVQSGTQVVFKWQGSFHNVDKLGSADDYANCNGITNTAGASGPFNWTAPANAGFHYFVCGIGNMCSAGNMKAAIEVSNNCAGSS